jgi:hypothetical protein
VSLPDPDFPLLHAIYHHLLTIYDPIFSEYVIILENIFLPASLALQSACSVVIAVTGVTAVLQNRSQHSGKVQSDAADALEHKQQTAALEKRVSQLEQARAAPSGWFSGWR